MIGRIAVWSVLAFALMTTGASAQRVINQNGGFEATEVGETTDIQNWQLLLSEGAVAEVVQDPDDPENNVLRVEITDISVVTDPWDIQIRHYAEPLLELEEGHEHQMSFRIRAENPNEATIQLDGQTGAQLWGYSISGDEWETITTGTFVAGEAETRVIAIHLGSTNNQDGQVFYIDDLEVVDLDAGSPPVVIEAESGTLGSEFEILTDDAGVTYITVTTDVNETTGTGDVPGENRTAEYEVTFDESGWYHFFARMLVGPATFDDDSFFYPHDFGSTDPSDPAGWVIANQLAAAGFNLPEEYVTGLGTVGDGEWKWVNLSVNQFNGIASDSFYVAPDSLTHTFVIGARENGLLIDKLAFGRADLYFTVANLDNVEPGSPSMGGPVIELPENVLAHRFDKFLGNIYSGAQTQNFEYYWNQVTPENDGKWASVEGTRDQMNWAGLDAAYALAKDNGLSYRHHVLVWGAQQPAWISDLPPNEQLEEIREWFEAVAERYQDIDYLEVVNEPLPGHNPPDGGNGRANYVEALGGAGETGWDWVITAFEMAREIFPAETQLMINDFGILGSTNAARNYRVIIDLLQERDLIDAIGVQGHAFSTRTGAPLTAVLDILGETGLPVIVTEMDVDGNPDDSPFVTPDQSDQNQLRDMQRIFPALWEHDAVIGITFWGWRPGLWRNDQEAYLVRSTGEERPALVWLREYLETASTAAEVEMPTASFQLRQAYPNPFDTATEIMYELSEPAEVTLEVFDLLGRKIQTLVTAHQGSGLHSVRFEAGDRASGVYLYRLQSGQQVETGRMVLAR